jgi:serine protease Do
LGKNENPQGIGGTMKNPFRLIFPIIVSVALFGCGLISAAAPTTPASAFSTQTVLSPSRQPPAGFSSGSADSALEAVYQRVSPSVLLITVYQSANGTARSSGNGTTVVSGSGFVWDLQGDVVTNNHVVENADSISVTFPDGGTVDAGIVGTDPGSDLAVVRVKVDPSLLHPVTLGDSDSVKVGQTAAVLGYPFGLDITMTSGIVSGLARLLPVSTSDGSQLSYSIPDVIQTDAPINPGNSGGVLVDDRGEVIGVPSANISTSGSSAGVGFAIPSNIVKMEIPTLISDGSYPHAYLGITGGTLTPDLAAAMGLDPNTRGLLIADVQSGGPAEKAGLRGSSKNTVIHGMQAAVGGDIITAADGNPVNDFEDLIRYMFLNKKIGDSMQVAILRDGKTQSVDITFTPRPG